MTMPMLDMTEIRRSSMTAIKMTMRQKRMMIRLRREQMLLLGWAATGLLRKIVEPVPTAWINPSSEALTPEGRPV